MSSYFCSVKAIAIVIHINLSTVLFFQLPEQFGPVRMLTQGRGNMVIVGTTRNCILQGSIHLKFAPIVQVDLQKKSIGIYDSVVSVFIEM